MILPLISSHNTPTRCIVPTKLTVAATVSLSTHAFKIIFHRAGCCCCHCSGGHVSLNVVLLLLRFAVHIFLLLLWMRKLTTTKPVVLTEGSLMRFTQYVAEFLQKRLVLNIVVYKTKKTKKGRKGNETCWQNGQVV